MHGSDVVGDRHGRFVGLGLQVRQVREGVADLADEEVAGPATRRRLGEADGALQDTVAVHQQDAGGGARSDLAAGQLPRGVRIDGAGAPRPRSSPGASLAGPSPKRVSACSTIPTSRSRRGCIQGSSLPSATRRNTSITASARRWSMLNASPSGPTAGHARARSVMTRSTAAMSVSWATTSSTPVPSPAAHARTSRQRIADSRRRRAESGSTVITARWTRAFQARGDGPSHGPSPTLGSSRACTRRACGVVEHLGRLRQQPDPGQVQAAALEHRQSLRKHPDQAGREQLQVLGVALADPQRHHQLAGDRRHHQLGVQGRPRHPTTQREEGAGLSGDPLRDRHHPPQPLRLRRRQRQRQRVVA